MSPCFEQLLGLALSNNLKFDVAAAMSLRGGEGTIAGGLESISHYVRSWETKTWQ
jgi:hypothetical protein